MSGGSRDGGPEKRDLQEQLQNQVSYIGNLQNQASLFLRISVATVGIIIATANVTDIVDLVLNFVNNIDIDSTAQSLRGNGGVTRFATEIVFLTHVFTILLSFGYFMSHLLFLLPINAYWAATPSPVRTGPMKLVFEQGNEGADENESMVQKYRDAITHNENLIYSTSDHLESVYDNSKKGIVAGLTFFLAILALRQSDGFLFIMTSIFALALMTMVLLGDMEKFSSIINQFWNSTYGISILAPTILFFGIVYLPYSTQNDLVLSILLITLIINLADQIKNRQALFCIVFSSMFILLPTTIFVLSTSLFNPFWSNIEALHTATQYIILASIVVTTIRLFIEVILKIVDYSIEFIEKLEFKLEFLE